MFSGMTSFLFGSAAGDVTVDQTQESQQAELNTMDTELGWVLVDTPENIPSVHNKQLGCEQEQQLPGKRSGHQQDQYPPPVSVFPHSLSSMADSCSPNCVQDHASVADCAIAYPEACADTCLTSRLLFESWIVTPPPCFTASGGVVQLEESPLENLLIEHPSMSVYHAHQGTESTSDEENVMAVLPASAHRQDVQQTHRRPHILTAHGSMELCKLSRFHQRQQIKSLNKQLNRKCTERSNKTCYQNSCKKRGSQRNRILRPSGCKSGRRGQRAV